MEIIFNSGERVFFSWRASGALHVDLLKAAPAGQPVAASTTLTGEALVQFLEGFIRPLMRRALSIAVEYPQENARNRK